MKRLFIAGIVVLMAAGGVQAQSNTIVGKWKIASLQGGGLSLDLENPENTRKALAEQIAKESGKPADSATLAQTLTMFTSMFENMSLEFTKDGKGIYIMGDGMGGTKSDTATYTVDYAKGIVKTVSKEEGQAKNEEMTIKFEGDYLTMVKVTDGETVKLRRIK